MKKPNHYILILCGGTGPRLWPLSRATNPKQFLTLFNKETLLEQTINRAQKICPSKNIFIVSNKKYKEKINKIIGKKIPQENLLFEPLKKNTAMAIVFGISKIYKINPNAIITINSSDHLIKKIISFKKDLNKAYKLASTQNKIVTLGIKPTFANPSFGYLIPQQKTGFYYSLNYFIEKPEKDIAQKLIQKKCFWNSDIHTFNIQTMISELKKFQPEYFNYFETLIKNSDSKTLLKIYKKSPNLNINQAISEKTKDIYIIPASFSWSDIGEWKSIRQNLKQDSNGIANINESEYLSFNSKNCLINGQNKKLIGLVGVNNLAVIDTPDALLICNLDSSFNVRDLVSLMVKNKKYKGYFLDKK